MMAESTKAADEQPTQPADQPPASAAGDAPAAEAKKPTAAKAAKATKAKAAVTTETTAALHGTPAPEPAAAQKPKLSAGVAADLDIWGKATDSVTGGVFEKDKDTGKITYTDRAGNVTDVD